MKRSERPTGRPNFTAFSYLRTGNYVHTAEKFPYEPKSSASVQEELKKKSFTGAEQRRLTA